jgi:hypothetical protein
MLYIDGWIGRTYLSGGLEVQPGLREVFAGRGRVGEGLRGVVGGEEVFDDGAGFPEGEGGVWVGDGGDAAVGVERFEGLCFGSWLFVRGWFLVFGFGRVEGLCDMGQRTFFEIGEVFEFGLVGDVELVEDDGYFPWVGTLVSLVRKTRILIKGREYCVNLRQHGCRV